LEEKDAPWDKALTEHEWTMTLRQFEAIQQAENWHCGFMIHWRDADVMYRALDKASYTNISPVYWYKKDNNPMGIHDNLSYAVELMVVARRVRGAGKVYLEVFLGSL